MKVRFSAALRHLPRPESIGWRGWFPDTGSPNLSSMRSGLAMTILALLLASCATRGPDESATVSAPPLPSAAELESHVRQHWSEWSERFAHLSGHAGEAAELVGVGPATCSYSYFTPECWVEVTGRFASGVEARQKMFSQFDRDEAGNLKEVVVMYHQIRR